MPSTAVMPTEILIENHAPPVGEWRNGTVCLLADTAKGASLSNSTHGDSHRLPLGVPFPIENDIFVGQGLVRIRHAESDRPELCEQYFRDRKRLAQVVFQGKFRRPGITMDQLLIGDQFDRKFRQLPPPWLMKPMISFFSALVPGIYMDLTSDCPSVFTNAAGGAQTMRIDRDGSQPPIDSVVFVDDVGLSVPKNGLTRSKRRKYLSVTRNARKHTFDPDLVYTFEMYDNFMDYGNDKMSIGLLGSLSMSEAYDRQAPSLGVRLKDSKEWVFRAVVVHEKVARHVRERQESNGNSR